jgi:hypothetical protein
MSDDNPSRRGATMIGRALPKRAQNARGTPQTAAIGSLTGRQACPMRRTGARSPLREPAYGKCRLRAGAWDCENVGLGSVARTSNGPQVSQNESVSPKGLHPMHRRMVEPAPGTDRRERRQDQRFDNPIGWASL